MRTRLPLLARLAIHPSSSPSSAAPLCGPSRHASTSAAAVPNSVPPVHHQQPHAGRTSDARESDLERALADHFLRGDVRAVGGSKGPPEESGDSLQPAKRVARVPDGADSRSERSSKEGGAGGSLAGEGARPAGQATASTIKKPTPRQRTRPIIGPEPVWPPRISLRDTLLQQPPPSTANELLHFLIRVKTFYRYPDLQALADFHASQAVAPFVSTASYRFLLKLAFNDSNLRLARTLLSEMEEKEVAFDEATQRIVVQGYLPRGELGPDDERRNQAAIRALRVNPSLAPLVPRRDLGEKGKGNGDPRERWKGWTITSRHRREMRELRAQQAEEERRAAHAEAQRNAPLHLRSAPERNPAPLARPRARVPPRPPLIIPQASHRLDRYAVAALVQRLVREDRVKDGFALARSWLSANKPHLDPEASPASTRQTSGNTRPGLRLDDTLPHVQRYLKECDLYHATSRVLMNILLKALFAERTAAPVIRNFITNYLTTYSADPPARSNVPELNTLRLLISGLRGARNAWERAASYVDWFGYRWGMPRADPLDRRRYYVVPPSPAVAIGLELADKDGKPLGPFSNKPDRALLLRVAPYYLVTPEVAVMMLRLAVESQRKQRIAHATKRAISKWWHALDKRDSEIWTTYETKGLVYRAIKAGLIIQETSEGDGSPAARAEELMKDGKVAEETQPRTP